jgi:hypothetical protein
MSRCSQKRKEVKTMDEIRRRIKGQQALLDLSTRDMAVMMGLTEQQWRYRVAHPDKIKLADAAKIDKILGTKILSMSN